MAKRLTLKDHLSVGEMERRYGRAGDAERLNRPQAAPTPRSKGVGCMAVSGHSLIQRLIKLAL
jgi:hypothetical protein